MRRSHRSNENKRPARFEDYVVSSEPSTDGERQKVQEQNKVSKNHAAKVSYGKTIFHHEYVLNLFMCISFTLLLATRQKT